MFLKLYNFVVGVPNPCCCQEDVVNNHIIQSLFFVVRQCQSQEVTCENPAKYDKTFRKNLAKVTNEVQRLVIK